jgi:hypothetical protein
MLLAACGAARAPQAAREGFSGYSITSPRPLKFTIAVPQPTP